MLRVPIVEEDQDVPESIGILPHSHDDDTSVAANGAEALERIVEQRPWPILRDVVMPVIDGWEVGPRQLADPGRAEVSVVCLIANVVATRRLRYPDKPVDGLVLLAAVSAACESCP
jgi:CheY-like chemotaxis protein